jgi:hypothetical protein
MGHASALFYGTSDDTLYSRITPSVEQREFLQQHWNQMRDFLQPRLTQRSGCQVSTWLQGSYKFGTLLKPVSKDEEYDVDVGLYFHWDSDERAHPAASQLRSWVQEELEEYARGVAEIREVEDPPKERCSRASYVSQFHIDIPVYHLDPRRDVRRLACLSGDWEPSDPKAIYIWFKELVPNPQRERLRRIVRYLKAWAAVAFNDRATARPSSVLLTVAAAQAFDTIQSWEIFSTADDEDTLIKVVKSIYDRLSVDARVWNPVDEDEDLNRIPADDRDIFISRLRELREAALAAEDAPDEASAALAWSRVFSYLMPLPETSEVEVVEEESNRALMVLPEVRIEVFGRNPRRQLATYANEVPSVAKNCDLEFTITNPHILPAYAEIEWTVRNRGGEAGNIGDLGHRRVGTHMTRAEEHTAYTGLHYMDCVVRSNGTVYAVRRIPVNVVPGALPARNPPRPSYTRLRSLLRRRRR